ncbi:MAG: HD domain-containing protein [Methylophilus sp.]|nr:HD domain-containing protein [Methylophilus sp.]
MNGKLSLSQEDYQDYPLIEKARAFAMQAHGSQQYGKHAYVYHLDQVAYYAKDYGETAVIIAYLHDILEDTDFIESSIQQHFGKAVLHCVNLLTDPEGESRIARKSALNVKLAQADESLHLALIVKAADRVANVRYCIKSGNFIMWKKYQQEYQSFREAAYRRDLCERLWHILDVLMEEDAYVNFKDEI